MSWVNLINLLGGLALFLYGMVLARDGLQQGAGSKLRNILGSLTRNRFLGVGLGALVTFLLQSSSATTVILVGLTSAAVIPFARTVAVILGADIGTTLTVQLISFKVSHYSLLFVFVGFLVSQVSKRTITRYFAEALMGFGFIFFGMQVMADATGPMRDMPWFNTFLASLANNPLVGILVSTIFTAIIQSSAATIGIALSFATSGVLDLEPAIAIILGANIGTCATAILATLGGATVEGRRVAAAHIGIKIAGVILLAPFIHPFADMTRVISSGDVARQIANAHTLFNILLAIVFVPFTGIVSRVVEKLVVDKPSPEQFRPRFLDPTALDSPPLALANASREVQRMANIVEQMIIQAFEPFEKDDLDLVEKTTAMDQKVDLLDKQTKLYLTHLSKRQMTPVQAREEYELVDFSSELEGIADIVCKNLMYHAQKRIRKGYRFSPEGLQELRDMHSRTVEHFRLAIAVFTSKDPALATRCIEEKRELRKLALNLRHSHIERLHKGVSGAIETTSLHMDVLYSFSTINSAITNMSYRILEWRDAK
ncbi:MAG: Na/Pi cotransporter family protein [Deltaproteobacteria bacterium]|nr:Na/Pi cotransporter family protein [Deltaproteobacteria bacterium]